MNSFNYLALGTRRSVALSFATQYEIYRKLGGKLETEYINTRFALYVSFCYARKKHEAYFYSVYSIRYSLLRYKFVD